MDEEVSLNPNHDPNDKESISVSLREALLDVMRVYINLVHDFHVTRKSCQKTSWKVIFVRIGKSMKSC